MRLADRPSYQALDKFLGLDAELRALAKRRTELCPSHSHIVLQADREAARNSQNEVFATAKERCAEDGLSHICDGLVPDPMLGLILQPLRA